MKKNNTRLINKISENFPPFLSLIRCFTCENLGHMAKYWKSLKNFKESNQKKKFVQRIIWRRNEKLEGDQNIKQHIRVWKRSINSLHKEIETISNLGGACSRWCMIFGGSPPRK